MKHNILRMKKGMHAALLVLLLGAVGIGKMNAQNFTAGDLNYSVNDDGVSVTVTGHVEGTAAMGTLVIPESVAYQGVPYAVTAIGDLAFYNCSGFTSNLIIPNSVTIIGISAFNGCNGFTGNLTIPNSVTAIGNAAFSDCSGFTGSLTIGNSVTEIGNSAFMGCSGFTGNLIIPNTVTTIAGFAFYNCSGFTGSLTIPNSVTSIDYYAFYGCSGFTGDLIIGDSITTIEEHTFCNCSGFTGNLTIGNSLTAIKIYAFLNCSGFTSMNVYAETPPYVSNHAFLDINYEIPVYVPLESVHAYQNASVWSSFTNIQSFPLHEITLISTPVHGGTVTLNNKGARNVTYDFENGSQGWTFLKGTTGTSPNNWMHCTDYTPRDFTSNYGHYGSDGFMISESYISNSSGGSGSPVTPDNFLVSPQVVLGGNIRFWASNPNDDYGNEHFGVFVSTTNNTNANSFVSVQEWTLLTEAKNTGNMRTIFDGIWYEYSADLSAFNGNGYVAIRHYNCTGQWLLCVDDISISEAGTTSGFYYTGQTCTAIATPKPGYEFVNWTENGAIVSSNADYSFTVSGDRTLEANFVDCDGVANLECSDLQAYPNPTNGPVKIEVEGLKHISVSNMLGQVIYEGKANGNAFEFDFSKHGVGLYLIRLETTNGVALKKVFVVR